MHRRSRLAVLLVLTAAALALPSGVAGAKGLTGLAICGTNGCVDRSREVRSSPALMEDLISYGVTVAAPDPAPYLKLKESMGDGGTTFGHEQVTYYPTLGIVGYPDGTFHRATPGLRRMLGQLARGRTPWGMTAEAVNAEPVAATTRAAEEDGGGIPTGAWLAGAAAAAILLALIGVAAVRRGRPATG
jgi:hypothetical protein